jgi:dihydroorotate dehydrogenase
MNIGLGAGVLKNESDLTDDLLACPAAFLTFGSYTLLERAGNKDPTYYFDEATQTSYNAIGLKNPGVAVAADIIPAISKRVHKAKKRFRLSLAPTAPGHLHKMLQQTAIMPLRRLVDQYEFNAACPNHNEGKHLHEVLSRDPKALRGLLEETKGFALEARQKALKIAPDTDEEMLRRTIDLCIEFGIGSIVSGNTHKVGTPFIGGKPMISVPFCGQGGTALLESSIKQMKLLAKIRKERKAPIKLVACGGISTGEHVRRYEDAGADEGQVATAFIQYKAKIFQDILIAA